MRDIDHFIVGGPGAPASRFGDVFDPNSGAVQARVPLGTPATLDRVIAAAQKAQPAWAATNPQRRARVMFNFKALVGANMDELARILSSEHELWSACFELFAQLCSRVRPLKQLGTACQYSVSRK